MREHDLLLCSRILEKCQQQRWYGGNERYSDYIREKMLQSGRPINAQEKDLVDEIDPDDHPLKARFACSPATEEQLQATEQELGFPLPPFLRLLYSHIANGGFGPGHGLIGAIGGFDEAGSIAEMYQYHTARGQLINLEQDERASRSDASLELPDTVWPRSMLYLCDRGQGDVSCLDCVTERVFLVHMGAKFHRYVLEIQASSLQEWWEQWIAEKPCDELWKQQFAERLQALQYSPFLHNDFDPFVDDEPLS